MIKMPVELQIAIRDGWKQDDNNRFGQCLEMRFINPIDGKILFRYAPNLRDETIWSELFMKLRQYDELHKAIFSLVKTIDGEKFSTMGDCKL
jgi:hypothetical protein